MSEQIKEVNKMILNCFPVDDIFTMLLSLMELNTRDVQRV